MKTIITRRCLLLLLCLFLGAVVSGAATSLVLADDAPAQGVPGPPEDEPGEAEGPGNEPPVEDEGEEIEPPTPEPEAPPPAAPEPPAAPPAAPAPEPTNPPQAPVPPAVPVNPDTPPKAPDPPVAPAAPPAAPASPPAPAVPTTPAVPATPPPVAPKPVLPVVPVVPPPPQDICKNIPGDQNHNDLGDRYAPPNDEGFCDRRPDRVLYCDLKTGETLNLFVGQHKQEPYASRNLVEGRVDPVKGAHCDIWAKPQEPQAAPAARADKPAEVKTKPKAQKKATKPTKKQKPKTAKPKAPKVAPAVPVPVAAQPNPMSAEPVYGGRCVDMGGGREEYRPSAPAESSNPAYYSDITGDGIPEQHCDRNALSQAQKDAYTCRYDPRFKCVNGRAVRRK